MLDNTIMRVHGGNGFSLDEEYELDRLFQVWSTASNNAEYHGWPEDMWSRSEELYAIYEVFKKKLEQEEVLAA